MMTTSLLLLSWLGSAVEFDHVQSEVRQVLHQKPHVPPQARSIVRQKKGQSDDLHNDVILVDADGSVASFQSGERGGSADKKEAPAGVVITDTTQSSQQSVSSAPVIAVGGPTTNQAVSTAAPTTTASVVQHSTKSPLLDSSFIGSMNYWVVFVVLILVIFLTCVLIVAVGKYNSCSHQ